MSRPSRPRESVFAGGPELYKADNQALCSASLLECVATIDDIRAETHDAQQFLRDGTFDLPRMARILDSQRVFLLVNESTIRQYKADLTDEIQPQIFELIEHARKGLEVLERRERALQTKLEHGPTMRAAARAATSSRLEIRRLEMLTNQRLRLEQELAALQADVNALEEDAMNDA